MEFESSCNFPWNASHDLLAKETSSGACFDADYLRQNSKQIFDSAQSMILGRLEDSEPVRKLETTMASFGCDKGTAHNYTNIYGQILGPVANNAQGLVELGIGSNFQDGPSRMHESYKPGASLRAWSAFFKHSLVVGAE